MVDLDWLSQNWHDFSFLESIGYLVAGSYDFTFPNAPR